MLQLDNKTPFSADLSVFPNEHGLDALYVIVKATFNIGEKWVLTEEQPKPQQGDDYHGDPLESSIRNASDYHIGKPATDIFMQGSACAPNRPQVRQLDVALIVGEVQKCVRAFGDRRWQGGNISAPEPFETMRMRYEKAFGGTDCVEGDVRSACEANPLGMGFRGKRSASDMEGEHLPNLEDPRCLIQTISDNPAPACFAAVAPNWRPRASYAGTYDEQWQCERSPFLPEDFDSRFLNAASADLIYPGYLQGGEPVRILNMHPAGEIQFNVPVIKLGCNVLVGNQANEVPFKLESLILEPNLLQVSMVWRAIYSNGRTVHNVKQVEVKLLR